MPDPDRRLIRALAALAGLRTPEAGTVAAALLPERVRAAG